MISADGTKITSDNVRSWQKKLGYVPQVHIFIRWIIKR